MRSLLCLLPALGVLSLGWAGPARYARLGEFSGMVEVQLEAADAWMPAEHNLPLPEGAWLRTTGEARLEVELDDGSVWRLGADSAGALADYAQLSTGQKVTLLTLDRGVAYLTTQPKSHDSLVLALPGAQVTFTGPARVRVEAAEGWSRIAVLEGSVRVSSPAAEMGISEGKATRIETADPLHFSIDRAIPELSLDHWSAGRDRTLASSASAQHTTARYGVADLDSGGEWIETDQWGTVWKPKTTAAWAPFRNGRWRWYSAMGYTFVGGDAWGWLPYHYGRWAHTAELGWIWAPNLTQVFKPGDVFWLNGAGLAGWGPLAPGERWPDPDSALPSQFSPAFLTYASYRPQALLIDPTGFADRPEDPLKVASFVSALPSPPFEAASLDAIRPASVVDAMRIEPAVPGAKYEPPPTDEADSRAIPSAPPSDGAPAPDVVAPPPGTPAPPPSGIPAAPPAPASPDPQAGSDSPIFTLYTNLLIPNKPKNSARPASATPSRASTSPAASAPTTGAPQRKSPLPDPDERFYRRAVAQDQNPSEQIRLLDAWSQALPTSGLETDRTFLYMQAYSRVNPPRPDAVVEFGARLIRSGLPFPKSSIGDTEKLTVLYQVTANVPKLAHPSASQIDLGKAAAQSLQNYLPLFFAPANRPSDVTEALWARARGEMEVAAKQTLAFAAQKP